MNELATREDRYVSVFEDPTAFAAKLKMAETLSQTQFVPEAFRGKPEDCLVVLDMAARLDLNPFAVFPDIYVIDNRASFSSKFLIALVNRCGRFSRIKFEEGIDGEAEVTFSGWGDQRGQRKTWKEKVPNYWAIASFTELTSGETYSSPRIDMKFADKNGWVQKNGSKWQTMPEIMCRYRSASILIKSTCPEIVMGMEWADDVLDAREESSRPYEITPRRTYDIETRPSALLPQEDDNAIEELKKNIENAKTSDELSAVGKMIADSNLSQGTLSELRTQFKQKQDSIIKKPTKRGKKEKETPAPSAPAEAETEKKLLDAVRNASDMETMNAVRDEIEIATTQGHISGKTYGSLMDVWNLRVGELQGDEVETTQDSGEQEPTSDPEGSDQQKEWGRQLCAAIKSALEVEDKDEALRIIEGNLNTAREWLDAGYVTESMLAKIEEFGEKIKAKVQGE